MRILSTTGGAIRHGLGAAAEAAVVVAIAVTLVFGAAVITRGDPAGAGSVFAARHVDATLEADPYTVAPGQQFEVRGQGYDPSKQTWLRVETATAVSWYLAGVDGDGNLDTSVALNSRGSARLSTHQVGGRRALAECSVEVQ